MYARGTGVPQDTAEAQRLWYQAARGGSVEAYFALACSHLVGRGDGRVHEATKALDELAGLGHGGALCLLGLCYVFGEAVVCDETKGLSYLQRAQGLGYRVAEQFLQAHS